MANNTLNIWTRNTSGLTLPFALILTFIFSALVGVSFLFVSVNLRQMESGFHALQAISIAEGINEKIKARMNTKSAIKPSPQQEERLKLGEEEEDLADEELEDEDIFDEEFDEETEDFDEYYADEILKISRFITFREPPEEAPQLEEGVSPSEQDPSQRPEANVEMIGSIEVPRGTNLTRGIMIIVLKDEKINLKLEDIQPERAQIFKEKLPVPIINSLSPNYSEVNVRNSFVVVGENLSYDQTSRFSNKNIYIENIKAGPLVEFLIKPEVMPGLVRFYWESTPGEFYIIPAYDGSPAPVINDVLASDGGQLLEAMAGTMRMVIMLSGQDLFLKKSSPVVISDVVGIVPKVKEYSPGGDQVTITLDIDKKVEPGVHTLSVATEGGISNSWIFNILPADEKEGIISANYATVTSALTLLDIRVIDKLLPLIDEEETIAQETEDIDKDPEDEEEIPEKQKLSVFANTDLETSWLLQTTAMVGNVTKTVSELVHRMIPNINAAITTNGEINFDGGGYKVIGATTAMTTLLEPTYLSNTKLVIGEPEKETKNEGEPEKKDKEEQKAPSDLGFIPGSLLTVYKSGERVYDLDYSIIETVGEDVIDLVPPGLMDFHYEGDEVFQFIPPIISKEKVQYDEAEKHLVPKDFAIGIPSYAMAINILRSNLQQFGELADLYTNDTAVPNDEFGFPLGYMGLSFIAGTPTYDDTNPLGGKGLLIVDTRADNQGSPVGDVEIAGDSKNPVVFTGVIYVHGNLRIDGNVTINGGLVVDNENNGMIQITSSALGKITWDPRAIRQTILYTPFTTKPGTVMISNVPIDLSGYVEGPTPQPGAIAGLPGIPTTAAGVVDKAEVISPDVPPEEALLEGVKPEEKRRPTRPTTPTIPITKEEKSAEEELIDLF